MLLVHLLHKLLLLLQLRMSTWDLCIIS